MVVPKHVAIIPDGNRRWAKANNLQPWNGHAEGAKRLWSIAFHAYARNVSHVTFWSGSYDNLAKRNRIEVAFLLKLVEREVLNPKVRETLLQTQARFRLIGEWREFVKDQNIVHQIEALEQDTAHFTERDLSILFAYDGQREMLAAIEAMKPGVATPESLRQSLWTGMLPDVDLVIRTGGEPHWSAGFMMWPTANSQFYFTETLWPAFFELEFDAALEEYAQRERRLGK